jgi:hypothetical protein
MNRNVSSSSWLWRLAAGRSCGVPPQGFIKPGPLSLGFAVLRTRAFASHLQRLGKATLPIGLRAVHWPTWRTGFPTRFSDPAGVEYSFLALAPHAQRVRKSVLRHDDLESHAPYWATHGSLANMENGFSYPFFRPRRGGILLPRIGSSCTTGKKTRSPARRLGKPRSLLGCARFIGHSLACGRDARGPRDASGHQQPPIDNESAHSIRLTISPDI